MLNNRRSEIAQQNQKVACITHLQKSHCTSEAHHWGQWQWPNGDEWGGVHLGLRIHVIQFCKCPQSGPDWKKWGMNLAGVRVYMCTCTCMRACACVCFQYIFIAYHGKLHLWWTPNVFKGARFTRTRQGKWIPSDYANTHFVTGEYILFQFNHKVTLKVMR